jgi:hypothetical protein
MNNGEIYIKTFTSSKLLTVADLKTIFATDLGAVVEDVEGDENSVYLYRSAKKDVWFKLTVGTGSNNYPTFTITQSNMAGGTVTKTFSASNSTSTNYLSIYYIKFASGDFMFGTNSHGSAEAANKIMLYYAMTNATNVADSSDTTGVAIRTGNGTGNTATAYILYITTATNYETRTVNTGTSDTDFIQLAPLVLSGGYVCENCYIPTYGGFYKHGKYTVNGEDFYASDGYSTSYQGLFLKM